MTGDHPERLALTKGDQRSHTKQKWKGARPDESGHPERLHPYPSRQVKARPCARRPCLLSPGRSPHQSSAAAPKGFLGVVGTRPPSVTVGCSTGMAGDCFCTRPTGAIPALGRTRGYLPTKRTEELSNTFLSPPAGVEMNFPLPAVPLRCHS
jgi:hypothetical protein